MDADTVARFDAQDAKHEEQTALIRKCFRLLRKTLRRVEALERLRIERETERAQMLPRFELMWDYVDSLRMTREQARGGWKMASAIGVLAGALAGALVTYLSR